MTVDEVIDFLADQADEGTLTRQDIDRCVLLVYQMGNSDGRTDQRPTRLNPFSYTTSWLADMGYATWRMVLAREQWPVGFLPDTLEQSPAEVQHAWKAAAAAIRRRVVTHRLPAEEDPDDDE